MSRLTENKAKKYLFHDFKHEIFSFIDKTKGETGFDIWLINRELNTKQKIELKATEGKYLRNADIFQKLYFSAENEIVNFKNNETKILRVFLGDEPPKLFIFDNGIFENGATFEPEARWIIKGKKNYDCIESITPQSNNVEKEIDSDEYRICEIPIEEVENVNVGDYYDEIIKYRKKSFKEHMEDLENEIKMNNPKSDKTDNMR